MIPLLIFQKANIGLSCQKRQDMAIKKPRKAKNRLKKPTGWEKKLRIGITDSDDEERKGRA